MGFLFGLCCRLYEKTEFSSCQLLQQPQFRSLLRCYSLTLFFSFGALDLTGFLPSFGAPGPVEAVSATLTWESEATDVDSPEFEDFENFAVVNVGICRRKIQTLLTMTGQFQHIILISETDDRTWGIPFAARKSLSSRLHNAICFSNFLFSSSNSFKRFPLIRRQISLNADEISFT